MILNKINKLDGSFKVRFAPSPTGSLHIGSARTAIVNYLFARSSGAKFLLRIEDTDTIRKTEESGNEILVMLKWLGIDWDEGPFYQSERMVLYRKYSDDLLSKNLAYRCFCTPSEIEEIRKESGRASDLIGYDGRCKRLREIEVNKYLSEGRPYTVRLKMSSDEIKFNDMIKGEVAFRGEMFDDMIIIRADNTPTYNFSVVIDDALMNITHIIRGEDHLSNTPKQIAIYKALGFSIPVFAHIPLILGPDKTKLSKRHCDTAIEDYRDKGFLSEAVFNYLAILGYSHDPANEIIDKATLIKDFDIAKVSRSPSQFDLNKLIWINAYYIKNIDVDILWHLCRDKYLSGYKDIDLDRLREIFNISIRQAKILSEIDNLMKIFFEYELDLNNESYKKIISNNIAIDFLKIFNENLFKIENFSVPCIEELYNNIKVGIDLSNRDAIQIVRLAVSGRLVTPALFDTLYLIGKEECIKRINLFLKNLKVI